ncbi:MAG TPA: tetratricopeptide repeat protein [Polyangiaceae bacterium]|jgi:tetratricopeptide (TPR) repeat protein|nr:tetratricopeptide repeat protein [Polyangiaceae bacterium]
MILTLRAQRAVAAMVVAASLWACSGAQQGPRAQALPPANAGALDKMVRALNEGRAADKGSRSVELLRQALQEDPSLWEARYNLGVLLADRGELGQAEKELATAASLAPNAEDVAVALGEVRRRRGEPKDAAQGLQKFVELYPKADAARGVLVGALREAGDYAQALEQARQILVRRPNDPSALAELALTYVAKGEVDTAELLSAEALKAAQPSAAAERGAGLIALEQGDDASAFRHFARATEIDPKDHTSQINIGNVLLKAGVYNKAEQHFRAVLELTPDDEGATLGLAAALRGQGARENKAPYLEAEKLLKALLERQPNDTQAIFNLGVLYARFLNQTADGSELMKRFLSEAAEDDPARALAQQIVSEGNAPPASKN